ncbi:MAG: ABC-2 family transporter protein [Thermomicrobiales bacterium]
MLTVMIGRLMADAALYRLFVGSRVRSQMQYRESFLVMLVISFFGVMTEFLAIIILFNRFDNLIGWDVGEVAFLYGLASVSFGLAEMFGAGFDNFPDLIRRGEFDRVLLRPQSAFVQVLSGDFQLRRLGRILQGLFALGLALFWTSVTWTPEKLAYLPVVIVCGMVLYIGFFVLGATLCFWTVESVEVANIITYGGTEFASYPLPIYHVLMQRIFTFVVPLAFVSYFPSLYLLDRPEASDWPLSLLVLSPLAAAAQFSFVAWLAWGFGVKHYRSTGS